MATAGQVIAKFAAYNRNWNQLCQAETWNACAWFGLAPVVYPSAKAAYHASKIFTFDPKKAAFGDFAYWSVSDSYHVAPVIGPDEVLMATGVSFGTQVGPAAHHMKRVSISQYTRYAQSIGAKFLGISHTNGKNDITVSKPTAAKPAVKPVAYPTVAQIHALQSLFGLKQGDSLGSNVQKAIQQFLKDEGFLPASYKVDGRLGDVAKRALQRSAKRDGGVNVVVDGKPENLSWSGFVKAVQVVLAARKKVADAKAADKAAAAAKSNALRAIGNVKTPFVKEADKPDIYGFLSGSEVYHLTPADYKPAKEKHMGLTEVAPGTLAAAGFKKVSRTK